MKFGDWRARVSGVATRRRRVLDRKQRGAAAVEFALAAGVFFLVLFTILDFGYLFWVNLTMQHAVREGVRYAVTGQSALDPDPRPSAMDRCNAAKEKIRISSMGLYDKLAPTVVFKTVDPSTGATTTLPGNSCYGAGQIIMIQVQCGAPTLSPFLRPFFPGGTYDFSVSATMRNEAFGT
jgi:Flp pilus assembly protein TadG